jgi:hypothetical protein
MPFNPQILDDLAAANANISIDAAATQPNVLAGLVNLYMQRSGTLTIRNASRLPPATLIAIAQRLNNRVTLVE